MAQTPDDEARTAVLRLAVSRVDGRTIRRAVDQLAHRQSPLPATIRNSLNALRKNRDPAAVVLRPQYRAAVPFVALGIAEPPLERVVEELGDHADDPTREQLEAALAALGDEVPLDEVAVMLAHVASEDMEASDLCFEVVTSDERFGVAGAWAAERASAADDETAGVGPDDGAEPAEAGEGPKTSAGGATASTPTGVPVEGPTEGPTEDPAEAEARREARRQRKREAASLRRKRAEAEAHATRQVRKARREERADRAAAREMARAAEAAAEGAAPAPVAVPRGRATAILRRPAQLTPTEEASFNRDDPLAGAVVFAWIPFYDRDTEEPEHDEKGRRCVVVAGSETEVLVRPGFSEGGALAEDWRATRLAHWSQAGFEQPTVIDVATVRVPRTDLGDTVGRLSTDDWNALW